MLFQRERKKKCTFRHGVDESLQPLWTLTAQSGGKEKILKKQYEYKITIKKINLLLPK